MKKLKLDHMTLEIEHHSDVWTFKIYDNEYYIQTEIQFRDEELKDIENLIAEIKNEQKLMKKDII